MATNNTSDRRANVFRTFATSTLGITPFWTPAAGKRFLLLGYQLMVTADLANAAGSAGVAVFLADELLTLGSKINAVIAIPVIAPGLGVGFISSPWVDLSSGLLSVAAGNRLGLNVARFPAAPLATGVIHINTAGIEVD